MSDQTEPEPGHTSATSAPVRVDGTPYRFELVYAGGTRRAYGDAVVDLLDALIPGYQAMSETDRWEARLHLAARAQVLAQAEANLNPAFHRLPPAQQTILQGPRHLPPAVPTWDHPVPLVLITTFYEPAGNIPRPVRAAGMDPNVVWIDPSDDDTFLNSLHDIGAVSWHTRNAGREDHDGLPQHTR